MTLPKTLKEIHYVLLPKKKLKDCFCSSFPFFTLFLLVLVDLFAQGDNFLILFSIVFTLQFTFPF